MILIKNYNKFLISTLLVLFSSIITFVILELIYRFYKNNYFENNFFSTLIFEQNKVFKNVENIFTYEPNIKNRRVAVISFEGNKKKSFIEYDYSIVTNNIGMVMKNDINQKDRVDLFLGDSFTEGQGAIPWFYKMEENWSQNDIPLNAGLLGTGPAQWYELANYLNTNYELDYDNIHIVMILTDLIRPVWNFGNQALECIEKSNCNYSSYFQGFNLKENNYNQIINHVNYLNATYPKNPREIDLERSYYDNIKFLLKGSYIISDLYTFFRDRYGNIFPIVQNNLIALEKINNMSKKKLTITLINKRGEKIDSSGNFSNFKLFTILSNWVNNNNLQLNICNFEIEDFHKYDAHLNKFGYDKLRLCIQTHISKFQ